MKADYVHKDSRTLEEKPQVFARWIDPTIEELQQENQSLKKENKILRENAEHNDKVVDKVNWENMLLKKENKQLKQKYENAVADYETTMFEKEQLNSLVNSCQEEIRQLKKQLEEYENEPLTNKISRIDRVVSNIYSRNKNQQKEFIEYLENEKYICDSFLDTINLQETPYRVISSNKKYITTQIKENEISHKVYEEILQKYKEIIGDAR